MKAGTHIVTVKECGVTGEGDKLQPFITFQDDEGSTITWYASLSTEKSREYAVQNAVRIGFIGRGWDDFNIHKISDTAKKFEIVVADREYNGKVKTEVKQINFARTMKLASAAEIRAKLAGSEKDFALYRAKNPNAVASKPTDDIPF